MEIYFAIAFAVFWFASMIWSFGETFAYYQRTYPNSRKKFYKKNIAFAWATAILGPMNIIILRGTSKNKMQGWLWPWSKKAKQEAGLL